MPLSQALIWSTFVQVAVCISYSNTTSPHSPTLAGASSLGPSVGNTFSISLSSDSVASRTTSAETAQHSSTQSKLDRTTTIERPSVGITNSANVSTITTAPKSPCRHSFTFTDTGGVSICLNCPQVNGTWEQQIPDNTASACSPGAFVSGTWHGPEWVFTEKCYVHPGTVSLFYWPTDTPNVTYASTIYNEALGVTFTSPSLYYVLNTLWATNIDGPLGPTATNAVFAYDLADVTTWNPTVAGETTAGYGPLQLSDLAGDCPTTRPSEEEALAYDAIPVNRCNPRLQWPIGFKRFGYPYWKHCAAYRNRFGVFDPPFALTQEAAMVVPTMSSWPSLETSSPATGATVTAGLPSSTSTISDPVGSTAPVIKASNEKLPSSSSPAFEAVGAGAIIDASTIPTSTQHSTSAGIAEIIAKVISVARVVTSTHTGSLTSFSEMVKNRYGPSSIAAAADVPEDDVTQGAAFPLHPIEQQSGTEYYGQTYSRESLHTVVANGEQALPGSSHDSPTQFSMPAGLIFTNAISSPASTATTVAAGRTSIIIVPDASNVMLAGSTTTAAPFPGAPLIDETSQLTEKPDAPPIATMIDPEGNLYTILSKNGAVVVQATRSTITLPSNDGVTFAGVEVKAYSDRVIVGTSTIPLKASETSTRVELASTDAVSVPGSDDFVFLKDPDSGSASSDTITLHGGEGDTTTISSEVFEVFAAKGGGLELVAGTSTMTFATLGGSSTSPISAILGVSSTALGSAADLPGQAEESSGVVVGTSDGESRKSACLSRGSLLLIAISCGVIGSGGMIVW